MGLIYNIVLPTLQLAHTVFIGISSRPVDEDSPMFRLISKRYPESGKFVIRSVIVTTTCNSCKRRGRRDCKHDPEDPWTSQEQSRKIELLMADRREYYEREMRNEESTEKLISAAFNRSDIETLDQSERDYNAYHEHPFVYVGIDPAAGGVRSKAAVMSIITPEVTDPETHTTRTEVVVRISFLFFLNYVYTRVHYISGETRHYCYHSNHGRWSVTVAATV